MPNLSWACGLFLTTLAAAVVGLLSLWLPAYRWGDTVFDAYGTAVGVGRYARDLDPPIVEVVQWPLILAFLLNLAGVGISGRYFAPDLQQ